MDNIGAPAVAPAIERESLPNLRWRYRIACARHRNAPERLKHHWLDAVVDLRRQIKAAVTGAPTWTDTKGTIYGAGALRVGGTVPEPGGWFGGAGF